MSQMPPIQPNYATPTGPKTSGMAIASMVLGIVSLAMFCVWYLAIPCAILAVVLGTVARGPITRGQATGRGMATAGIVCGVIALGLAVLAIVGLLSFLGFVRHQIHNMPTTQPHP